MGLDSNEIDQVVVAGGWTSVNQRPPEGRVQTMIAWEMNGGCELFCGTAVYRNGSYWNDETMLDTPSWWRKHESS